MLAQVDGQAIELELGRIGDGEARPRRTEARRTRIEGQTPCSVVSVSVRIDSIGTGVDHRGQLQAGWPPTPPGRQIE